jgi:hypothetical protein
MSLVPAGILSEGKGQVKMRSGENSSARASAWREYAESEIAKASSLPSARTSWSPSAPSETAIARAYALVKAIKRTDLILPITSAGPDGVLCLEWRQPGCKLVFSVLEDGIIEFYLSTPFAEGEIQIRDGLEKANEVVEMFCRRQ